MRINVMGVRTVRKVKGAIAHFSANVMEVFNISARGSIGEKFDVFNSHIPNSAHISMPFTYLTHNSNCGIIAVAFLIAF